MRKMPKHVFVLGRKIPVKSVSRAYINKLYEGADGIWSLYDGTIFICNDMPMTIQRRALFHEITHAMHSITGLDQCISREYCEALTQSTASLIEDVLKQF